MDTSEKDEVPMLSSTDSQANEEENSQFRTFKASRRSASMSIAVDSMEPYEYQNNFVGHTGPLRNERRTPFIQMSGPLYVSRKHENLTRPNQGPIRRKVTEPRVDYPSINKVDQKDWPDNYNTGRNEHLLRSGQLGMCNDPYCTTCPTDYNFKGKHKNSGMCNDPYCTTCPTDYNFKGKQKNSKASEFHNVLYGDAKGWARRIFSFLQPYIPGVMSPHAKVVQQWNQFFVISCLIAIFLDPLFFFLLYVQEDNKCIAIDWTTTKVFVVFRSVTDFIYLLHMLLQFRLAYIAPESRVIGAGDLVDHPKKIALNYLKGNFLIDFFAVLPLPQIIILFILPNSLGSSGANYAKNLLRAAVLVQDIPRLYRLLLPLLAGQSPNGFIFESAWANFVINLLIFVLSGHVVGSCWYLFGLQRVNQCLRDACHYSRIERCTELIDCDHGNDFKKFESYPTWTGWKNNTNARACFSQDGFTYGIYGKAVNLTAKSSITTRYVYSLFWGLQQISTLAGNQTPSYFVWEVLFTMAIIGLGLFLFALLIGNMQNFLQALGRRRLEMSIRRHDVEQWMSHRRLPLELRRNVRDSERYNWSSTRGVNEEMLLNNLPEDLQRQIRRPLFKFVKKVRIFSLMDEPILDTICERLRQKTYIKGSKILYPGGLVEMMVFIVRGKMESIGEDGIIAALGEGDVCGEELLRFYLEHSSVNKDVDKNSILGHRLLSNRMVKCLTYVEAFILRAADLEEVTSLCTRFLRNTRGQGAIRYESPYWRGLAADRIQVAWRYRKKRLSRSDHSRSHQSNNTS